MKKALVLVVSYLAVAAATTVYILGVAESRGVGTWDGRGGGQSLGTAHKSDNWQRDNMQFVEVHMMWICRDSWCLFKRQQCVTIGEAIAFLGREKWDPEDGFWRRVKELKKGDDTLEKVVDSVRLGGGLWTLRAYHDRDLNGKTYSALEIAAVVQWPPDYASRTSNDRVDQDTLDRYIRDPIANADAINRDKPKLMPLFSPNPGLQEWLKVQ